MINKLILQTLKQVELCYKLKAVNFEILGKNENIVLKILTNEKSFVCRITSDNHRSEQEILEELKVLSMLKKHGASVVKTIKTIEGKLFTKTNIQDNNSYISLFEFEKGKTVSSLSKERDEKLFFERGKSMGQIHYIISTNNKEFSELQRLQRNQEVIFSKIEWLLEEHPQKYDILKVVEKISSEIHEIPKNEKTFGITHTDIRPRNFQYDKGKITHFDFDDICYHWFAYDIAVSAFHAAEEYNSNTDRTIFLKHFLGNLVSGYISQKELGEAELENITTLMSLRCVYAYIDYYKRLKIKKKDEGKNKMLNRHQYILDFNNFVDTEAIKNHIVQSIKKSNER